MIGASAILLAAMGCAEPVVFTAAETEDILRLSPLPPLPPDPTNAVADDPEAAWLGQAVFYDPAFSADGGVSCATCHDPAFGFSDGRQLSEGLGETARHAPTLYNAAYQRWFYWDGRRDSQWAQALSPLEHPGEHGLSRVEVLRVLSEDAALLSAFEDIFGPLPSLEGLPEVARPVPEDPSDPAQAAWDSIPAERQEALSQAFASLGKAVAAYERLLISQGAPFDDFVAALSSGDAAGQEAYSEQEKLGLRLFIGDAGCTACHSGPLMSDLSFHNVGLGPREWLDSGDLGRWDGVVEVVEDPFNGAGAYSDAPEGEAARQLRSAYRADEFLGAFKTPGLREVASNAPYMHGGQLETLEDVVRHYNEVLELPANGHREEVLVALDLSGRERDALVAFLESLSGAPLEAGLLEAP